MTPEQIVYELKRELLSEAMKSYEQLYAERTDAMGDSYSDAIELFQTLRHEDQRHVVKLVEIAIADTISSLLGWLDGEKFLRSQTTNPILSFEGGERKLNGTLQDTFLNAVEKRD